MPVFIAWNLWSEVWQGVLPRAWDGTGHYAIAQIYDSSVFPDTFGWTHSYFGGMPFPNFYPPLFYWGIAFLHGTHLLSFPAAFKLFVVLPVLILPAMMWLLGWKVSGKSHLVAFMAALASTLLLTNSYLQPQQPAGLDYFSTFQIGLYTQPLGFALLIAWYVTYTGDRARGWKFTLSCVLMAMTVLANFFSAVTAVVFIITTLVCDAVRAYRAKGLYKDRKELRPLIAHSISPIVALLLTSFWVVPMLSQYEYFVTRPQIVGISEVMTPGLWAWYALAVVGSIFWACHRWQAIPSYLFACLALLVCVFFTLGFAPSWFPLYSIRFFSTLTFLLAVPVGYFLATVARLLARKIIEDLQPGPSLKFQRVALTIVGVSVTLVIIVVLTPPPAPNYAFYRRGDDAGMQEVLDFARQHRGGRYLVATVDPKVINLSFDGRAINAYLGSQGNETLTSIFHEASANSLFVLPQVNALSESPDSYGISSLLTDDLDFLEQPLEKHLDRARHLGVRYLVVRDMVMKQRLGALKGEYSGRYDFGVWSVFELSGEPFTRARALQYLPALVVSTLTLKQRRQNELGFIRLAEEQLSDNWFDVVLANSPETRIGRLSSLGGFGALIVTAYEYNDENAAFALLQDFARRRALILFPSESNLYKRMRASRSDFPMAEFIEGQTDAPGPTLNTTRATARYDGSVIRQQWKTVREILENNKVATPSPAQDLGCELNQNRMTLSFGEKQIDNDVPVLVPQLSIPIGSETTGGRSMRRRLITCGRSSASR